jgi:hypothetical protein
MRLLLLLTLVYCAGPSIAQSRAFGVAGDYDARLAGDSILTYLNTKEVLCDESIGENGIPAINHAKFVYYTTHYSIDSIKMFMGKEYGLSLRIYSFWALLRRNYNSLELAGKELLTDTTSMRFYSTQFDRFPTNTFLYELLAGNIDNHCITWPKERLIAIRNKYYIKPFFKDSW